MNYTSDRTTHEILSEILKELKKLNKHNAVYVESSLPVVPEELLFKGSPYAGQSKVNYVSN